MYTVICEYLLFYLFFILICFILHCLIIQPCVAATYKLKMMKFDWWRDLCEMTTCGELSWSRLAEGVLVKIDIECSFWQWQQSCQHESKVIRQVAHINVLGSRSVSANEQQFEIQFYDTALKVVLYSIRALGPELIPVVSARRWPVINQAFVTFRQAHR